ncbi:putative prefoldin subunit 4 [Diplonema papillatum]|nr:putative prefoldin subunit 4 [Diplonema papillatum]
MGKPAEEEPANISVTWEDQKKISNFCRLHKRKDEVIVEVETLKKQLDDIMDAETEIYIADDIKYGLGQCFLTVDTDQVDTMLGDSKEALEGNVETLNNELEAIAEVMKGLKAELHAKFGNAVYLDTDK